VNANSLVQGLHPSKGQFEVPSQVLHDHLGYEINILRDLLRVPERRCHTIRRLAMALRSEAARNRRLVPTRLLQQFTGTACSTSRVVLNARFHLRSLYDCTALTRPHSRLSRTVQDLEVWAHFQYDSQLNGVPLFTSPTSVAMYIDASGGVGWGGVLPPLPVQERLCHEHQRSLTLGCGPAPAGCTSTSRSCALFTAVCWPDAQTSKDIVSFCFATTPHSSSSFARGQSICHS
jgi:hypothetical protein